jgi:putative colanic acid biosynthesis glycosyltransferase
MGTDFSNSPLISIITPVLNGQDFLEDHIRMVQSQTYANKELIIIDGGSTDRTVDKLKSCGSAVDFWMSMPDQGIYDAMNRGIESANGRWLFFSGVDDCFFSNQILEQVFQNHEIAPATQLICGNVIRSDGKLVKSRFDRRLYYKNSLPHQGVFYRRDIFDGYRYGGYKKNGNFYFFKISGDYHLNFHLFASGAEHRIIDCIIMQCGRGRSMRGDVAGYVEEILIRHAFIGHWKSIVFDLLTVLRYIRRRFFV